jgi:hypothetical protein
MKQKNKEQPKKMPLGLKRMLLLLLMALAAKGITMADELYNVKVIECYEFNIGRNVLTAIGVDTTGNGITDQMIYLETYLTQIPPLIRLVNLVKQAGVISIDNRHKVDNDPSFNYGLNETCFLEIGGRSVLEIFPGQILLFPYEAERQERLKREAAQTAPTPQTGGAGALTPEEQRLLLELLRKQQGSN